MLLVTGTQLWAMVRLVLSLRLVVCSRNELLEMLALSMWVGVVTTSAFFILKQVDVVIG